jgi:hypothetical protein
MKEELILLKLRNNLTGEYIDISGSNIKKAEFEYYTLDNIIDLAKTVENKEGWVIEMDNISLKVKTEWYRNLHGLLTDDLYRENILIKHIINDDIDDIISEIPEEDIESIDRIDRLVSVVKSYTKDRVEYLENEYNKYKGLSLKEYALNHIKGNKDAAFILSMKNYSLAKEMSSEDIEENFESYEKYERYLESKETYNLVVNSIINETKRLELAREWLMKRGFKNIW